MELATTQANPHGHKGLFHPVENGLGMDLLEALLEEKIYSF
jgi:hypothetical protein